LTFPLCKMISLALSYYIPIKE